MKKTRLTNGMTLIELLTVMTIIMILASLVLAVVFTALRNAKRSQAQTEVNLIATAIKAYQREYMRLPFQTNDGLSDLLITNTMTVELQGLVGFLTTNSTYNPQQIDFLKTSIPTNNILSDPWGMPYAVFLDLGGDGKIRNDVALTNWSLGGSILVFSYGPDKSMATTNASLSVQFQYKVGDNIFSQPL